MNSEYLQKYLSLPPEVKEQIPTSENLEIFSQLEKEYRLDITEVVTRLLINDVSFDDLPNDLINNYKLNQSSAQIVKDSLNKILLPILSNLTPRTKEPLAQSVRFAESRQPETGAHVQVLPTSTLSENRDNILTKEEINELAAQPHDVSGNGLNRQASLTESRRAKTDEMISDVMSHFTFPDSVATGRLKNIIINYLKDIRDEIGTKDVLTRPFKVGGMEFDNSQTDFLISVLKNKKDLLRQFNSETQKIPAPLPLADGGLTHGLKTAADFVVKSTEGESAEEPEKESKRIRFEEGAMAGLETFQCPLPEREIAGPTAVKFLPTEAETKNESLSLKIKDIPYIEPEPTQIIQITQKTPEPINVEPVVPSLNTSKEETLIPSNIIPLEPISDVAFSAQKMQESKSISSELISELQPQEKSSDIFAEPLILNRSLSDEAQRERRIVEEVKVTPKIYGPIDELRTVRLVDWRRWRNSREAADRIKDKINLLAEDSLLKASQGIKAWKESEVNKLYIEIGLEALEKEKTIEEVISNRLKENRQALTFEDFNIISELNEKLRF